MRDSIFCDKIFRIAFAVSFISHAVLLLKTPGLYFASGDKTIEVTYLEEKTSRDSLAGSQVKSLKSTTRPRPLKLEVAKGHLNKGEKLEAIKDEITPKKKEKKIIIKKTNGEFQKKKDALHQLPEFYDYYRYLRKRIKEAIFYPQHFQEGEVLINFTLFRDGALKEVSIVDNLSADNAYLRYAAIQSVKDASPFKPFPKELTVGEIPFQIFISFEFLN